MGQGNAQSPSVVLLISQICQLARVDPRSWGIGLILFLAGWRKRPANNTLVSLCSVLLELVVICTRRLGYLCYNLVVV